MYVCERDVYTVVRSCGRAFFSLLFFAFFLLFGRGKGGEEGLVFLFSFSLSIFWGGLSEGFQTLKSL